MKRFVRFASLIIGCAVVLCVPTVVIAQDLPVFGTYAFYNITNNNPDYAAIGEAQLSVDVANGDSEVKFIFKNEGPNPCSITDVYFDDGTLLELIGLIDLDESSGGHSGHPGVNFSPGATPSELPGNDLVGPAFETTIGFSADSDPPPPSMGVEPGEWLGVIFTLTNGGDVYKVMDELNDGTLRIGIHVQAFNGDGASSESFINVPEPATVVLLGLGGLLLLRKRRV